MKLMQSEPGINRTILLPAEIYREIKRRAEQEQRSFNWVAVRLLREKLEEERKDAC
jgi:hypothetical protein